MTRKVAIVLAAGQGKRMKSRLSKVLHPIAGRPLVYYSVLTAFEVGAQSVVVVASADNREGLEGYLAPTFGAERVTIVVQDPPRGTGDAARVGMSRVDPAVDTVWILYADTPLLQASDVAALGSRLDVDGATLAALSCRVDDPSGYGRIVRDEAGRFIRIVEDRDLESDEQRGIREINAGVYAARAHVLGEALETIVADNAQGEYYLTDVVPYAVDHGGAVAVVGDASALLGVNDRNQLAAAEAAMFRRIAARHGLAGVTVRGDARIDDAVTIGADVTIDAGVHLRGDTVIEGGAHVDVGSVLTNCRVARGAVVRPYTVATDSSIGSSAQIGPFSHLRPGSAIDEDARIGNFVETKNSRVGSGAKANHLAYLGDTDVGAGSNIGAGTIVCNYDGFAKHRTVIGEGVFVGSDCQLVAPVTLGRGAYVATGTTVTHDVPEDALAIGRIKQENKEGYATRLRARLKSQAERSKKR